jgi:phage baseplate assembly protein W
MNQSTGRWLTGIGHFRQSLQKILTTRIGTRIERREFGSLIPDLIDSPANPRAVLLLYAATVTAIMKHEPRLRVSRISAEFGTPDNPSITLSVEGVVALDQDQSISLQIPLAG